MTAPTPSPREFAVQWTGAPLSELAEAVDARDASLTAPLREEVKRLTREITVRDTQLAERVIAPDRCPITGRPFFMAIDGVATYGGPHDSFTIPERDEDGFVVRHYDHDEGGWSEDENVPVQVVTDERIMAMTARAERAEAEVARLQNALIDGVRKLVEDGNAKIPKQFRTLESPDQIGDAFRFAEREVARLRAALQFYADPLSYRSPSTGFELQYDPEPSPIARDRGRAAAKALAPEGGK